jgi:hypothetical protein
MDMLVVLMFYASLLGVGLLILVAGWKLGRRVAFLGWTSLVPRVDMSAWTRFWFTPRDPTVLGLIRILCGAVTTYTVFAYSFMLQDFMGKDSWCDLRLRLDHLRTKAYFVTPLGAPYGQEYVPASPSNQIEEDYCRAYKELWGVPPPPPFPTTLEQIEDFNLFRRRFGYDLRRFGLKPPQTQAEVEYIPEYMDHPANILKRPPPAYPADVQEKTWVFDYMASHGGIDPRLAYSIGQPAWSIWFHVTNPAAMSMIHALVVLVAFLFTIGFCTRVTSVLIWMTSLWYIHRNPILLFGVDTMMVILLLYLMIGSSGAALSVDRLIARWWSKAKPRVVNRWRALWGRPPWPESEIQPAVYCPTPVPTVSANFAMRMLQVHLCIIYLVSGISKLQGPAWWGGTAVWGTLANFEFAPMAFEINHIQVYNQFLRFLGGRQVLLDSFLTGACIFTVAFELGYAFLIWRPSTRWLFLAGAVILHGFIGLLMGLKTFSLIMLVMNMGFLRREEVDKFLRVFKFTRAAKPPRDPQPSSPTPVPVRSTAVKSGNPV